MSSSGDTPCGCGTSARRRVRLLDGEQGLMLAAGGLVVSGDTWEAFNRGQQDREFLVTARGQQTLSATRHEYVHYLQALGSRFLQIHARTQLSVAVRLMRDGPEPELVDDFNSMRTMLSIPRQEDLSCLDILESGAVLEGYKLDKQDWGIHPESPEALSAFPAALDEFRHGGSQPRYFVAFDWLQRVLGFRAAYLMFLPLSFVAFNTDDPVARFTSAARYLSRRRHARRLEAMLAMPVIDIVRQSDISKGFWLANPQAVPDEQRVLPVSDAACRISEALGVEALVELCGRPWRLDPEAPTAVRDLVAPLALAWSSADGMVELQLASLAADDHSLLGRVLSFGAVVGAAERLCDRLAGVDDVYRFCPHDTCPHYGPALCHRYYLPPPLERHHASCNFISTYDGVTTTPVDALWSRFSP